MMCHRRFAKYSNDFAAFALPHARGVIKEAAMKLLVLGAVLGAMVVGGALPASAQIVIRDRDRDAAVVVHEGRHEGWRHEGWRHEGWRRHHADCRVIKVRKTLPNGNVIVKTRRTCD
jgi:hypothetical protein